MLVSRSFALRLAPVVLTALAAVACGEDSSSGSTYAGSPRASAPSDSENTSSSGGALPSGQQQTSPVDDGAAQRAIAEADIVQIQNGRLYALSKTGSLSIIDVSKPNQLTMLGQAYLPGEPFEMYLTGDRLTLMMNGVYSQTGQIVPASSEGVAYQPPGVNSSAGILVVDVRDPGLMQRVGTFAVPGTIADSRLAGDVLYVVTYQNQGCWSCASKNSTVVTSFDLSAGTEAKEVAQIAFGNTSYGNTPDVKRSIIFGNGHLWVGGPSGSAGAIDLVDVSDAGGKLEKGAHIETAGPILSRWQMSEKDDVLRVISQVGNATGATYGDPQVQTFQVWSARSVQTMAKVGLQLPRPESLKAVRFDADRAYAITFERTDPLFIIDLSDPMNPQQRGELEMPGYVVHLEPRGDRLIGLGVDERDSVGQLNVSLFDVSNMDTPRMLSRVSFGGGGWTRNEQIQQTILPEDQDRLQKAFKINDGGLITIPYSNPSYGTCATGGGVQLVDWKGDAFTKQALLPVAGNPRRAIVNQEQLIAVSDSNVTSFDLKSRYAASKTADLVIGTCELRTASGDVPVNSGWNQTPNQSNDYPRHGYYYDEDRGAFACSTTQRPAAPAGWLTFAAVGLAVGALARRRASRRAS
ncbi:MAG: beta-propeller domain-containing protein [Labilithrix sp.]|nr:beta-propeller domain-containing protein [Labilithrix sp.]MCW5811046.1 beta-propeller domain-containing protein [Labilithrix sp.]